jgi:hypothetical protein
MSEPAIATAPVYGLRTGDAPVPLAGVSVDVHIHDVFADVTITQRYRNCEAQPIEVVYVFPLDDGATVCGFEAVVGDVHYVGEVKDREAAFEEYDTAISQGHGAYLLDEERPDVFTASLGNVPPGAEVLLKLTYVTELAFEGDAVRFMLPTTVSPRFAPAEDRVGVGRSEAEALNPPVAWRVPYGLDLSVTVALTGVIAGIASPSHPVAVRLDGTRATVTLAQRDAALDRDFVLLVTPAGAHVAHAVIERDDAGTHAVAVVFRPQFDVQQAPAEIIFLVDRSGSMGGSSIAEVRNALQICLRSLTTGCRFNILGFGSTFESLFPESRPYDETSLAEASAHVASLDATLGGTKILPALEFALRQPRQAGMPRQVIVLTDGQVTNTDAVLALVRRHASNTRVFAFGIGRGASLHLVRGMARAGGGVAEFISPGERIEPKVMRQFERLLAPALGDVTVDWGVMEVTQAPAAPPPVFAGGCVIVYGLAEAVRDTSVTLTATGPAGPVSVSVPLDASQAVAGRVVVRLAARARIRELEESPNGLAVRGSRQVRRKTDRVPQEIVRLATTYGLASRETSFVAVERRTTPVEGEVQLRRVPVALTSGWGGLEERAGTGMFAATLCSPAPDLLLRTGERAMGAAWDSEPPLQSPPSPAHDAFEELAFENADSYARLRMKGGPPRPTPSTRRAAAAGPFEALVALQRADGSWELTAEFAQVLGSRLRALEAEVRQVTGPEEEARRAWATALALVWLERQGADRCAEWRLLAGKAERWLDAVAARPRNGGTWSDAARAFLSR